MTAMKMQTGLGAFLVKCEIIENSLRREKSEKESLEMRRLSPAFISQLIHCTCRVNPFKVF